MTQSPVRFAILGFGHHAVRRLLPAFSKCTEAKLTGMWRRDQVAAAKKRARHWDDTLRALGYGKAVLCEKPVAMNAAEAEEMQAAARAAGLLYGVAQNF